MLGAGLTLEQSARLEELAEKGFYEPEAMTDAERTELVHLYLKKNHAIH